MLLKWRKKCVENESVGLSVIGSICLLKNLNESLNWKDKYAFFFLLFLHLAEDRQD